MNGGNTMNTLKNCYNPLGEQIRPEYQKKIKRFLDHPNYDNWDEIAGIIINTKMDSIWNAMIKYDSTFPRRGRAEDFDGNVIREWERIPTPFELLQAIKEYTK
jgi:hypothetical protein